MTNAPVLSSQPSTGPLPYTYGYVYGDNCIRFNGGEEVNGGKPKYVVALYDDKAMNALKARIQELESRLQIGSETFGEACKRIDVLKARVLKQDKLLAEAEAKIVWGLDSAETNLQRKVAMCTALNLIRAALSPDGNSGVGK